MKKSELTQLTQIIEHLVRKEVRKQLPGIIAETFQNMMGNKQPIVESTQKDYVGQEVQQQSPAEKPDDFKLSMRELFAGATPTGVKVDVEQRASGAPRHFTNNPVINQILNETTPDLRQRERMVGGAAMLGGYSPSVALAAGQMGMSSPMVGAGEMMTEAEMPSFARGMPSMPGVNPGVPVSQPRINENAVPAAAIPEGVSALDVARQVPLAQPVAQALTKNYSAMMKLIDSKRKGKVA